MQTQRNEEESKRLLSEKFFEFIENHEPLRVSRRFRNLLMEYIAQQTNIGFPVDFDACVGEFNEILALLEFAADHNLGAIRDYEEEDDEE